MIVFSRRVSSVFVPVLSVWITGCSQPAIYHNAGLAIPASEFSSVKAEALKGDTKAMMRIAAYYSTFLPDELPSAIGWVLKAAEAGDRGARISIATMLKNSETPGLRALAKRYREMYPPESIGLE